MTEIEKQIYIKQRAIQIKRFQDTRNGHLLTKPYDIEKAIQIAKNQLETDLKKGGLRITLDELLTFDDETCIQICHNRLTERFSAFKNIINNQNPNL